MRGISEYRVTPALLVMGFGGLVAEILLLKELIAVFSGNDLCIGIILGNWLLLEALGSFLAGRPAARTGRVMEAYIGLSILFCAALPAAVYGARMVKQAWSVSVAEPLPLEAVFLSSLLILLPVSLLHGAHFTFGCRLHAALSRRCEASAARVYAIESIGTLLGGVAGTYLLFPYLNAFRVTALVACLHAAASFVLLTVACSRRRRVVLCAVWLFVLSSAWLLFGGLADRLHVRSVREKWRGHNVVYHRASRHGHIAVIENEGQYAFFMNGVPTLMVPVPDTAEIDVFAHIPLLGHPAPKRILLIGGGAGGIIAASLQHPSVSSLVYVEVDPLFPKLLRTFPTPLTEAELNDPRVAVLSLDGRHWLKTNETRFDLIGIGIAEPSSLQANRYFTREFFALARDRLDARGILAFGLPGTISLADPELDRLHARIYRTLLDVFPHARVMPGEGRFLLLASASPDVAALAMETVVERLHERDLAEDIVTPWHIEQRLHPGWRDWFARRIADTDATINRDFKPQAVYDNARHWAVRSSPAFEAVLRKLDRIEFRPVALAIVLSALLAALGMRRQRTGMARLSYAMATTGFAGMVFGLVVIAAFQVVHGYVLGWIGLLVAAYMTGSACGAWWGRREAAGLGAPTRRFALNELALLLFALALPAVVAGAARVAPWPGGTATAHAVFLATSFLAGVLTAHEFPLANTLLTDTGADPYRAAGRLYALDLLGGWVGGMLGSIILLPVLGLRDTCWLLGILKLTGLLLMADTGRRQQTRTAS